MKRIHDGAIGDIVAARGYWNQGALWNRGRKPEWTDIEWQLRNWLYFTWLCGDHIVEQHVHNIDVVNWAMKAHPVRGDGMGGRQVRTGPEYGHIFDHFAVDYEYENGVHLFSMCRQQQGTREQRLGGAGRQQGHLPGQRLQDHRRQRLRPERAASARRSSPYVQEHTDFIASIRKGEPVNELKFDHRVDAHRDHGPRVGLHRQGGHLRRHRQQHDGAGAAVPRLKAALSTPPVPMPGGTTN